MTESTKANNKCSIEMFIKLALTLFFKRQQHRKLSWLDNLMKFQLNTCYILLLIPHQILKIVQLELNKEL
jgi:hypothetical protein